MDTPTHFVIQNSGGDTRIRQMTEAQLLAALQPNECGDADIAALRVLEKIPDSDTNYWGNGIIIIKGEIIVPKAKEVVTRFEL